MSIEGSFLMEAPTQPSVSEHLEHATERAAHWRVLVVEDVPSQQKLLAILLKRSGHTVSTADNGREAVELALRENFDVILMDIQMPGMNGLDATRAIRAAEIGTGNHVAIVAVTAHALHGDAQMCLAAGTDAYLRKPINLVELMALLRKLTGKEPPDEQGT